MSVLPIGIWNHHHQQCEATRCTAYLSIDIRPGESACAPGTKSRPIASEEPPEHNPMQVLVRDNNIDQVLRVPKKRMQREGVFRENEAAGASIRSHRSREHGKSPRRRRPASQACPQAGDPGWTDRRAKKEAGTRIAKAPQDCRCAPIPRQIATR